MADNYRPIERPGLTGPSAREWAMYRAALPEGHKKPSEATRQRRLEILAAFAAAPPGEPISQFCERMGISPNTWRTWLINDPEIKQGVAEIRQARATIDMEPFREHLRAVCEAVLNRAINGSYNDARMILESMGLIKAQGSTRITTVINEGQKPKSPDEELRSLLEDRQQMTAMLRRAAGASMPELPSVEGVDGGGEAAEGAGPSAG